MATETKVDASKEGEKLDTILSHLDSLHKRMDAADKERADSAKRLDAACERMDSMAKADADKEEEAKKDAAKKDAEKEEEKKADAVKADAAKKDAEEKEEKEEKAKADAAKADAANSSASLHARIEELSKMIPKEIAEEDRAKFVDAQSKAERVAQAFGDSAPRFVNGEGLSQYRQRLLSKFKQHSAQWKDVDLSKVGDDVLNVAETAIYADAWGAAIRPASIDGVGVLREVHEQDRTGRRITRFYGDPEACWGAFKQPSRIVTGWGTKLN